MSAECGICGRPCDGTDMSVQYLRDGYAHLDLRAPHWNWTRDSLGPMGSAVRTVDGEPVAICRFFPRLFKSADIELTAMGIGGVFTAEAHRGHGHASRLLQDVLHMLRRRAKEHVAVLHARNGALYARLGFVEVQRDLWACPTTPGMTLFPWDFPLLTKPWVLLPGGRF